MIGFEIPIYICNTFPAKDSTFPANFLKTIPD